MTQQIADDTQQKDRSRYAHVSTVNQQGLTTHPLFDLTTSESPLPQTVEFSMDLTTGELLTWESRSDSEVSHDS